MDADRITVVSVQEMETTARKYTAVRLLIRGDWYSRDVTSDRDIRQAHELAQSHGAELRVAPSCSILVDSALRWIPA